LANLYISLVINDACCGGRGAIRVFCVIPVRRDTPAMCDTQTRETEFQHRKCEADSYGQCNI
jgi:hypothetical protein